MAARPWHPAGLLVAVLLATGLSGFSSCENSATAPDFRLPRSPEQLVRAVEWSWDNQSLATYRDLFTADFLLACADSDSAGGVYRGETWTRDDELAFFAALVDPHRSPPLTELTLDFDRNLVVGPDPRPGKDPEHHQRILTPFVLTFAEGTAPARTLTGQLEFFVVRGDSAQVPEDFAVRGSTTDSRIWYLERWEDVTVSSSWCAFRNH